MKILKNENGVITLLVLVSIIFLLVTLLTTYMLISRKVQLEKKVIAETRTIYAPSKTMNEIYNSYFSKSNIVPIYTVEQLLAMGPTHTHNVNINGQYYDFNNDENTIYLLKNDLEIIYENLSDAEKLDLRRINTNLIAKFEEGSHFIKYTRDNETAVIPKGFRLSAKIGEDTITGGLVIKDAKDNEFVWIPVNDITKFYRSEWEAEANKGGKRGASLMNSSTYIEPYSVNQWEVNEYNAMVASVDAYGGFYIGRYEAGSTVPRTSSSGKTPMVVKKNMYPYNYVPWGESMNNIGTSGAVFLSKHLLDGQNTGAVSTLCYGVQWDAMLDFIKDANHSVYPDSTTWGNYNCSSFMVKNNTSAKYSTNSGANWTAVSSAYTKLGNKSVLLTTGATDRNSNKNIYDIAGNVWEWTMEMLVTYPDALREVRGGGYDITVTGFPASERFRMGGDAALTHDTRVPCCPLYKVSVCYF